MDLLNSKVKPMYFKYLAAASGSALVSSIFAMADAMMVGQYHGPVGNAALAVFNPLWSIIYSLGLLAGIGGSIVFATARGRRDEAEAQSLYTLSVIMGLVFSVLAVAGIGLFNEPLFRLFGADDELLVMAQRYLKPLLWGVPCCLCSNILAAFLRNDGNPGLATKSVVISGIFNVIADYGFVFVLDMGISGAGLATSMAQFVNVGIMLLHFVGKKNTLRLVKPVRALKQLWQILVTGFPSAISDLAMGIICVLFNRQIMKHLGADALAVYGVITQVTAFVQCLAYGAGQAAQPILSQNYGAGQYSRIRECLKYGIYTSAVMGLLWAGAMTLTPGVFITFFMDPTPSVAAIAPGILRAYGISYLILPFNIFATYYFQAMMKAPTAMTVSIARGAVVSGALIALLPVIAGANSLWYAMLLTEIIVAAYGAFHMKRSLGKFTN